MRKRLLAPLHREGKGEEWEGSAITPFVCFADTSLLYRVPAQMRSRCVGRGDASRAVKPQGTQRRTCGLCGDEEAREERGVK